MRPAPAMTGEEDDEALMVRVQADDPSAFAAFYDRFGRRAYTVAYMVARDRSRAEDIVQEAFLSVWRARAVYSPQRGSVAAWLMGTVRHRAIDSLRRHHRHDHRRADADEADHSLEAPGDVEEEVVERDEAARLRRTLARLPDAQREVITLAYFGQLSTSEIADELSLPLGTVKGRMRLGLMKLRDASVTR